VLYVPGAEEIKSALNKLMSYAEENKIPIWGSKDRHFPNCPELQNNGGPFPKHCMTYTSGMRNISETRYEGIIIPHKLIPKPSRFHPGFYFPEKEDLDYILKHLRRGENLILEKQHYDVFSNPLTKKLFEEADVTEAVVFGVATDYCVKAAALGMKKLGIEVYIVEDAIKGVAEDTTKQAVDEMKTNNIRFISLDEIVGGEDV
jgi:nicotinamidase-related amidase